MLDAAFTSPLCLELNYRVAGAVENVSRVRLSDGESRLENQPCDIELEVRRPDSSVVVE